jgi:DNA-binding response OmpR family regulator
LYDKIDSSLSFIFFRISGPQAFCASKMPALLRAKEASEMTPHILSIGKNHNLMSSRSLILRKAGYVVQEARTAEEAIRLVESDLIDAMLICHTLARPEQKRLIAAVRAKRRLMPILCVRSYAFEDTAQNCIALDNEPETLLNTLRSALNPTNGATGGAVRNSQSRKAA